MGISCDKVQDDMEPLRANKRVLIDDEEWFYSDKYVLSENHREKVEKSYNEYI